MSGSRAPSTNRPRRTRDAVDLDPSLNAQGGAATPSRLDLAPEPVPVKKEQEARDSPRIAGQLLSLERPLSVFPSSTEVRFGPGFVVSPDTLCQVAFGYTVENLIRVIAPTMHLHLRKFKYSLEGTHLPTLTTRKLLAETFSSALTDVEKHAWLSGDWADSTGTLEPAWRTVCKGFNQARPSPNVNILDTRPSSRSAEDIAAFLNEREDAWQYSLTRHAASSEDADPDVIREIQAQLDRGKKAWSELPPRLSKQVFLFAEESLRCIAILERRWRIGSEVSSGHTGIASHVLSLLAPGHRPMGHWLKRVGTAIGTKSLKELEAALLRAHVQRHGLPVTYDLLKKWSACKPSLLPVRAMDDILKVVRDPKLARRMAGEYFLVRVLTFLCDLICSGIVGAPATWADVQSHLHRRYSEVRVDQSAW